MIIKHTKQSDSEQIFELFKQNAVYQSDLGEKVPKRGFFEYHLGYDDIEARVNMSFSIKWVDKTRIIGYILAYSLKDLDKIGHQDPVHNHLLNLDKDVVYIDQLCINPNYPITLGARLGDSFEYMLRMEKVPGVVTAVPESPWKNHSSTRLVLMKGFSRKGLVKTQNVSLRLFVKPYLKLDTPFEGLGDGLIC